MKEKRFENIVNEMADLYRRKNADYGDAFTKIIDEFGYVAGVTFMTTKLERVKSLLLRNKERNIKEESVSDTLRDLANYCVMMMMEVENRERTKVADSAQSATSPPQPLPLSPTLRSSLLR